VQANPPAKNFWSLTIYDTYNRVQLDNPTQVADISSRKDGLKINEDGSVDLYLGPKAPDGWQTNWIETVPDKAWFAFTDQPKVTSIGPLGSDGPDRNHLRVLPSPLSS
jgi:hypothetical protein